MHSFPLPQFHWVPRCRLCFPRIEKYFLPRSAKRLKNASGTKRPRCAVCRQARNPTQKSAAPLPTSRSGHYPQWLSANPQAAFETPGCLPMRAFYEPVALRNRRHRTGAECHAVEPDPFLWRLLVPLPGRCDPRLVCEPFAQCRIGRR